MRKPKPPCRVCGDHPAHAKGLCFTDYQFFRRNGRERTEADMVRHGIAALRERMAAEAEGRTPPSRRRGPRLTSLT